MANSIWGILFVMLGLIGVALMNNFTNITTVNEQNYHLVEEVTEAAMYDSLDLAHYRYTGELKIIEEKFVENFIRRYAESANFNKSYNIRIYDVNELPPKVSLIVGSSSELIFSEDDFQIENSIDAILETKPEEYY